MRMNGGTIAVALLMVIAVLLAVIASTRFSSLTDGRLIGTWQSDAERTIRELGQGEPGEGDHRTGIHTLFGKLRVTFTPSTLTTEMDGRHVKTVKYEVLGKDKCSVVIREITNEPSPLDQLMELSEFTVIQFEGPDTYWITTPIGGIREYFKRVR